MKVVYISQFSDVVGGGEHSLLDLMRELPPQRWQAQLITPAAGPLAIRAERQGIATAHLPMPKLGPASLPALWRWLGYLRATRPDLLHANNSRAAVYAGIAGRLLGIPMVFHCRIAERDRRLDGLIGMLATRIVANSEATSQRFLPRFASKVETIYNGVPLPKVSEAPRPWDARLLMLFVGRLSVEKQPNVAIRVFERLASGHPGLHLALVGGDDPFDPRFGEQVRLMASHSRHASRIHFAGHSDEMSSWYAVADLLLVTSLHEGFGRAIVEAMGCGIPVAAFAVGGVPEIVEDGVQGRLVDAQDQAALADAVGDLLSNAEKRRAMGKAGRQRAQSFLPSAHAAAVEAMYTRILGRSS